MSSPVVSKNRPAPLVLRVLTVLSVGVLLYLALNTDFSVMVRELNALPSSLVVFLLGLQIVTQLSLNYQWYRLCRVLGLRASFAELLVVNAYGTVVDAANPGEKVGGEVARLLQLHTRLGLSTNQATSLVTIQKSLSLSALIILSGLAVITLGSAVPGLNTPAARWTALAVLVGLAVLLVYALFFTENLSKKVQGLKGQGRAALWLKRWVADFAQHTQLISGQPGEWGKQFLLSLTIWTLFPLKLQLLVFGYGEISFFVLFAVTFISYFAAMIPLLPGGLGTFEAAMGGMLTASGLSWETALAISLAFRFVTFWFVVLLSALIIVLAKMVQLVRKKADEK